MSKNFKIIMGKFLTFVLVFGMIFVPQAKKSASADEVKFDTIKTTVRSAAQIKEYTVGVTNSSVTSKDSISYILTPADQSKAVTHASIVVKDSVVDVTYAVAAKVASTTSVNITLVKNSTVSAVSTYGAIDDDGDVKVVEAVSYSAVTATVGAVQVTIEAANKTKSLSVADEYKKVIIPAGKKLAIPYTVEKAAGASSYKKVKSIIKNTKVVVKAKPKDATKTLIIKVPKTAVKGNSTQVTLKSGNKTVNIKVFVRNKAKKLAITKSSYTIKKGKAQKIEYTVLKAENNKKAVASTMKLKCSKSGFLKLKKTKSKKGKIIVKVKTLKKGSLTATLKVNGKKAKPVTLNIV